MRESENGIDDDPFKMLDFAACTFEQFVPSVLTEMPGDDVKMNFPDSAIGAEARAARQEDERIMSTISALQANGQRSLGAGENLPSVLISRVSDSLG